MCHDLVRIVTRPSGRLLAFAASLLLLIAPHAGGQVRVSPSVVNVSSQNASTVFLTFSGLVGVAGNLTPAEGVWCGALISAGAAGGRKCDPATLYGVAPVQFNQSRPSGTSMLTDIMSVPAAVARRAYQAAAAGGSSSFFFYVRRFVSQGGGESFAVVTCRLVGSGVGTQFALTDVRLGFAITTPVLFVRAGAPVPPISAEIRYTGTGQLKGRWELVRPGEELPQPRDLLTEASLPPLERGTQRRYEELSRFNVFLPPTGKYTLRGPDVSRLPTTVDGGYLVLLRIEVSDGGAASLFQTVGDTSSAVPSGAVAGFPLPTLRYVVGTGGSELSPNSAGAIPKQLRPADNSRLKTGRAVDFTWTDAAGVGSYLLEIEREDGSTVLRAVLPRGQSRYRAPPWLAERAGSGLLRWRVVVIDGSGEPQGGSDWRRLRPAGGR